MMRNRWWAAISVLAMVGVWAAGSVAWAGSGQVVPGGPDPSNCDDPGTADVVETCDGRRPGDVSLEFAFMFPPTQADADDAVLALTRANRILCDATDGQVRIARVRWVVGDAAAETADIRWYYSSGLTTRSRASDVGQLGVIGQHVAIMTDEIKGDVVAHELGHYLLGLYDSYAEDPKAIGPGFDGESVDGFSWVPKREYLHNWILPWSQDAEHRHSIMQPSNGYFCADAHGWTPSQVAPAYSSGGDDACRSDSDCKSPPFSFCPVVPSVMSELSVASNFDLLTGAGTPPAGARESREIVLSGHLLTTPCAGERDNRVTTEPGEECEAPGESVTYSRFGYTCTTTCRDNCLLDLTDCQEGPPRTAATA